MTFDDYRQSMIDNPHRQRFDATCEDCRNAADIEDCTTCLSCGVTLCDDCRSEHRSECHTEDCMCEDCVQAHVRAAESYDD